MTMQFSVTGKQMDVGDALRRHIEENVGAAVSKYYGSGIEGHAVLGREKHLYCCDLSVHIGRGILMQASEKDSDPYQAFDKALGRITARMRRHKNRLRDHHLGGARIEAASKAQYAILSAEPETAEDDEDPGETGIDRDFGQPTVIAEMTTEIATLTVGEAVMRLDLADQAALVFRSRAHGGLNVIYRRRDGHIGWIDPHQNDNGRA